MPWIASYATSIIIHRALIAHFRSKVNVIFQYSKYVFEICMTNL